MSGRYVSSQLIKSVQSGGKTVAVEYVEKTTSWIRPSDFPSQSVKDDFVKVAQNNVSKFKAGTIKIAMKCVLRLDGFNLHAYRAIGKRSIIVILIQSITTLPLESMLRVMSLMSNTFTNSQ